MATTKAPAHQSSRLPALKRRRVNADLDAEYRFHDGGALFIPHPPLPPEEVSSSSMTSFPPDFVPSAASMPLPDPIRSKHQDATVEENVAEESLRSSEVEKERKPGRSSEYDSSDASEKPSAPDETYTSFKAAADEDDSSVDSASESEDSSDGSEPRHLAHEARKTSKRKYPEEDSQTQKEKTRSTTTNAKRRRKAGGGLLMTSAKRNQWVQLLEELKQFKAKHGHCRVPKSSKKLYKWLTDQRARMLNPNHSRSLKDASERERRTEELESVLGTNLGDWRGLKITKDAIIWGGRLEELKKFKAMHGHCNVPTSSGELYNWLYYQRTRYLNPNHSRSVRDASEVEWRTEELESVLGTNLGDWRGPKSTNQAIIWDANLDELKNFKANHGHCRVPKKSYGTLYNWLAKQRTIFLNPSHSRHLRDVSERERRTKKLESVLCRGLTSGTAVDTRPIKTRSRGKKARP